MAAEPEPRATSLRRMIVGYRLSAALHVAAKLGIADILAQGPKDILELGEATTTDADALCRVMRLLASEGVFEETAPGRFKLTSLAEPLRSDVADSLRGRANHDRASSQPALRFEAIHADRSRGGETARTALAVRQGSLPRSGVGSADAGEFRPYGPPRHPMWMDNQEPRLNEGMMTD